MNILVDDGAGGWCCPEGDENCDAPTLKNTPTQNKPWRQPGGAQDYTFSLEKHM